MRVVESPWEWAEAYDFSQGIVADGQVIFTSGQAGYDETGELVGNDFEAQLRQAYKNLAAVLEKAGSSLDDVVRINTYLLRPEDFETLKRVRREFLKPPFPTSVAYYVAGFVFDGMLVELDAVATVNQDRA